MKIVAGMAALFPSQLNHLMPKFAAKERGSPLLLFVDIGAAQECRAPLHPIRTPPHEITCRRRLGS
jgi:hypothetical protein